MKSDILPLDGAIPGKPDVSKGTQVLSKQVKDKNLTLVDRIAFYQSHDALRRGSDLDKYQRN